MPIIINTKYVQLQPKEWSSTSGEVRFYIESAEKKMKIDESSSVIIAEVHDKEIKFASDAFISSIGPIEEVPLTENQINYYRKNNLNPQKTYRHYFDLIKGKLLVKNNLLTELEYSLRSVYRFKSPIVHFQQQFRSIPQADYDTIVNGWVYVARTIFGKLVNAIPRQNKLEFMLTSMNHFSTIDFKEVSLLTGVKFLYEYIEDRILSRGRLLVETNKMIKNKLGDLVPFEEVGFINPKNEIENTINPQASIFEQLFSMQEKINFLEFVNEAIAENAVLEARFQSIFKKETWPIDLAR